MRKNRYRMSKGDAYDNYWLERNNQTLSKSRRNKKNSDRRKKNNREFHFERFHEREEETEDDIEYNIDNPYREISRLLRRRRRRYDKNSVLCSRKDLIKIAKKYKMNFSVSKFIELVEKDEGEFNKNANSYPAITEERNRINTYIKETILMLKREWEINKLGF